MDFLRLNLPLTGFRELRSVRRVIDSGFLTQGPKSLEFESLVSNYVGVNHAFAVSSATTGLHLALVALGIKPGDEVVVPDFTFPATANVVEQMGATPKFVDIDPVTYNIDAHHLAATMSERTRAVMPVHAFGLVADMSSTNRIAARWGVPVLEDAACALGGTFEGQQAGSLGEVGVFSFHPRKIITTGEGGMVVTNNSHVAEKIHVLKSHGGVRGELYMDFFEAGFNYRLSDVHSALGVAQMARLDNILRKRRALAAQFAKLLEDVSEVSTPQITSDTGHAFQSYVISLAPHIDRDQVIREMRSQGIETTIGTYALHLQPYYRAKYRLADELFPQATLAFRRTLTLPLYPQLKARDLSRVVNALRVSIQRASSRSAL